MTGASGCQQAMSVYGADGRSYKLLLDAGLLSPGDPAFSLRFWCVEAGYSLSPGSCLLANEVMAHCALWH